MNLRRNAAVRGVTAAAVALAAGVSGTVGAGGLHLTGAHAAVPNQLPYMCFNTAHTFHQTFGPNSFFTAENVQGPTSFNESGPTPAPTVTFPLYTGTANGHTVYYVITDASDRTVATKLGVNYTPKLLNTANTSAVQLSSSSDPTAINVPTDVDFSPVHVLVPGPNGFPPSLAAPGAVGNTGYSPLVQLPNGVVINAPQIGDGTTLNGADKSHWASKAEETKTQEVKHEFTDSALLRRSRHLHKRGTPVA